MKTLVTGATGFLGSHIAEQLAREGHTVRVLCGAPAIAPSFADST